MKYLKGMIKICLISLYPPGVPVDEQHLRYGAEVNDEGGGSATVLPGGKLLVERSMDQDWLIRNFLLMRDLYPDCPAVFHSRLSTGSAVTLDNCHPFAVNDSTVVFHNGSLPYVAALLHGDCDTKVFAEESFPHVFADLDDPVTFGLLEAWATPANKLAIVTSSPRYNEPVYIVNRDQWIATPEGVLHSNQDFLGKGYGWDEVEREDGLYRWRILAPGQCGVCHAFHSGSKHPLPLKHEEPAERNETERRAKVAAAR